MRRMQDLRPQHALSRQQFFCIRVFSYLLPHSQRGDKDPQIEEQNKFHAQWHLLPINTVAMIWFKGNELYIDMNDKNG